MSGHQDLSLREVLLFEAAVESARLEHAAELARLTRELEEARERERAIRVAVTGALSSLVCLEPRWDPKEEAEWVRRAGVVEAVNRIKDAVYPVATPQEASEP